VGPATRSDGPGPPDGPAQLDVEAFLADPTGELRRCAHAHWYADGLGYSGEPLPWVLGHEEVRAVLRDRRLSPRSFVEDMRAAGLSQETTEQLTPLFRRDGEEHRQHRALLAAAFTPRRIEQLRPMVAAVAARLADGLVDQSAGGPFVARFAALLPPEVFATLFGLPADDRDQVAAWSATVALAFSPGLTAGQVTAIETAGAALRSYCAALVEARRREPADDLITHLVEVEVDGARLDDRDVVATMSGFIFAGSETTRRQLTALVLVFAEHPEAWDAVAADPDLVPRAVEEVLRHRGIIPGLTRTAAEPFEHAGLTRAVGERLLASVEAANHDPAHFPEPDRFRVDRVEAGDHVTFGWGPHFCLGAGLARVELQESLRALVGRFGPPVPVGDLDPAGGFTVPDEVTVRFERRP
jgi:cytochrome P450